MEHLQRLYVYIFVITVGIRPAVRRCQTVRHCSRGGFDFIHPRLSSTTHPCHLYCKQIKTALKSIPKSLRSALKVINVQKTKFQKVRKTSNVPYLQQCAVTSPFSVSNVITFGNILMHGVTGIVCVKVCVIVTKSRDNEAQVGLIVEQYNMLPSLDETTCQLAGTVYKFGHFSSKEVQKMEIKFCN